MSTTKQSPPGLFKWVAPVAGLLGLFGATASADSISPTSFAATLGVGESVTIKKTVTVSAGTPTSSKVDVFFLADDTGSMFGEIAAVQASATAIMTGTAALGDVAFGVGRYGGETGDTSYSLNTAITTSVATAQAGINTWSAGGGGDLPEANLYGLYHVASDAATGWRAGSERLIVWFGDAPGHDPSPGGTAPSDGTVTLAQTIAALNAAGVAVLAVDVGALDSTGQATAIATATGGTYSSGISSATIVATISAAITTAIDTYTTVNLDISEVPAGVTVTYTPAAPGHVGVFDRSIERTFDFDVTFTGDAPGDYSFNIYGTVDGGRVATEADRITVPGGGGGGVPDGGSTLALLGLAVVASGFFKKQKTRR